MLEADAVGPSVLDSGAWPGERATFYSPNAKGCVVRGNFQRGRQLGTCEVHASASPTWGFVAEALGFEVVRWRLGSESWAPLLKAYGEKGSMCSLRRLAA